MSVRLTPIGHNGGLRERQKGNLEPPVVRGEWLKWAPLYNAWASRMLLRFTVCPYRGHPRFLHFCWMARADREQLKVDRFESTGSTNPTDNAKSTTQNDYYTQAQHPQRQSLKDRMIRAAMSRIFDYFWPRAGLQRRKYLLRGGLGEELGGEKTVFNVDADRRLDALNRKGNVIATRQG